MCEGEVRAQHHRPGSWTGSRAASPFSYYVSLMTSYFSLGNITRIGLGTEFRSEKIPRNRLGTNSVIPRKKCPFRGIPNSAEEQIPKLGTELDGTEFREKIKFYRTRTASMMITLTSSTFYKKLINNNSLLFLLIQIQKRVTSIVVDY